MAQSKDIYVYMDWQESDSPIQMGVLHSEVLRGKEVFSFEYNTDCLTYKQFRALDPDLAQFAGKQYLSADKSNFGMFLDSSPDRWGRMLMRRREAVNARLENRPSRTLTEADYLLGVYDGNRMGALRFKLSLDDEFMDAPGSSLGGARPKANILDNDGALWIAKFPSGHDAKDMGAWEAVTAEMARKCGIEMAESRAQKFSNRQHTFLTKRFDRKNGRRIHFASAMTLLGYTDGADSAEGVSYLELAEWIGRNCDNVSQNLEQLWRRIVFNIAVSNCDDHLRNHGFLLTPKGWTLSPAYDINPDGQGMGLKLNISEDDNSLDFELALSVAAYFGLDNVTSNEIINQTKKVISNWQQLAGKYGISRSEQEDNAGAFRY